MMQLPQALVGLFDAENRRDWEGLAALLHPDVEWTVTPSRRGRTVGIDAYLERLEESYRESGEAVFKIRRIVRGDDALTATELVDQAGNISLEVFELDNGLVRRAWSYLFEAPITEPPDSDLLVPTPA
ncbi:nuclear transport factor 2 family protein [Brachybacterium sp.]|uniref:nuclear transport factor 2 family protein n=1 Tax=Brachybacterium sp. TaxID=1891286 RepID=UPI002ED3067F